MLELRPTCEHCNTSLDPQGDDARICTYECTFCSPCATWELMGICPNCTGELVTRPRRPASMLTKHPATTTVTHHPVDLANHQAKVLDRLQANDLPAQVWTVSFPNTRSTGPAGNGYNETAAVMDDLAKQQPGYIGIDSVRGEDGVGITVSRWTSIAAMVAWRKVVSHAEAQHAGRDRWYTWYRSDVARVDRTSEFNR